MRILGLLGVLLWLGTLLANAGGADVPRFAVVLNDDGFCHAAPAAASAAAKADDGGKDLPGFTPDLAPLAFSDVFVPRLSALGVLPRGERTRAFRRLLVAWHLGRGPPPASVR